MTAVDLVAAEYWANFWEWIADKAFILVVVFLAIEYITGRWAKPHREALDDARKLEVAQLTKEAARLSADGEQARAAAADANARALEAKAELAKFKAARTLSADAIERISDSIKGYKNVEFDAGVASPDSEYLELLLLIEQAAIKAGWKEIPWNGSSRTLDRPGGKPLIGVDLSTPNVGVGVDPSNEQLLPAASALAAALNKEDIVAVAALVAIAPPGINTNKNAIHIIVGRKS